MINFRTITLDQVDKLLNDTGYETPGFHKFAEVWDLFKYIGCADGAARYLIGYQDEEEEDKLYASIVYVTIGNGGTLVADWGGCPEFETTDIDELTAYFERRCN